MSLSLLPVTRRDVHEGAVSLIVAECTFTDDHGAVGIHLELSTVIVRECNRADNEWSQLLSHRRRPVPMGNIGPGLRRQDS